MLPMLLLGLLLLCTPMKAQRFGVQLKAGAAVSHVRSEISVGRFLGQVSETSRFVIGPAVEWRLTPKIAVEFGVIFQSADLGGGVSRASIYPTSSWKIDTSLRHFPVLAKYRFLARSTTPFAIAGGAIRSYSHSGVLSSTTVSTGGFVESTRNPFNESHTDVGWAVGGGVEFKLKLLRISPELRYMRFGDFACDRCTNAIPSLAVNPLIVMLGVGF